MIVVLPPHYHISLSVAFSLFYTLSPPLSPSTAYTTLKTPAFEVNSIPSCSETSSARCAPRSIHFGVLVAEIHLPISVASYIIRPLSHVTRLKFESHHMTFAQLAGSLSSNLSSLSQSTSFPPPHHGSSPPHCCCY